MILLRKNQLNKIAVTLSELKNNLIASNWLFVFELEQSQGDEEYVYRIQLLDQNAFDTRYNLFELIEGTDLTLPIEGSYKYYCYQMPDDISTDETQGELVETGMMLLVGEDETEYTHSVASNTYINE